MPGTVILDGGADNCDCNHLYARLSDQRRASGRNVPRVDPAVDQDRHAGDLSLGPVVDAVVAKPITPESLQPVVDRLLETRAALRQLRRPAAAPSLPRCAPAIVGNPQPFW